MVPISGYASITKLDLPHPHVIVPDPHLPKMEKRRQELSLADSGHLKPLGRRKEPTKRPAASGLGEDLGNSGFQSVKPIVTSTRPKLTPNPLGKPKHNTNLQSTTESDADPIDFLSSQEPISTGSASSTRAPSNHLNKPSPVPQPPPFSRISRIGTAPKPSTAPKATPTPATIQRSSFATKPDEPKTTSSSRPATRSKTRVPAVPSRPSTQFNSSEDDEITPAKPVRQPAPAPFAGLSRSRPAAEERKPLKQTSNAPKPAPPPFKGPSSALAKPKRAASSTLADEWETSDTQPPMIPEHILDPVQINKLPRIPRKGQTLTSILPKAPAALVPKRVPAEFPMAAYAREAAAKMAAMEVDPPSPRKRFRPEDIERLLQSPSTLDDSTNAGEDTLLHVDPKDLCPFCDEPLPDNPSPDLLQTLAELRLLAKPEPRARNPLGLMAPLTTFINLCHMHRAETTYVHQGKVNRWPVVIHWSSVRERLKSKKIVEALQEIISDPRSSYFFVTLSETIKRQGVLRAASIRAQLDTFELSHPGYYGEQGTLVFFDVLTSLFPELSPEQSKPLQPREFFLSVLVPEAAALLVEQDMDCAHEEALKILRESRQYGQMMFPDRGDLLGLGEGSEDRMDEAGAKQLQWRKDMIQAGSQSSPSVDPGPRRRPKQIEPSPFRTCSDDDVLVLDE